LVRVSPADREVKRLSDCARPISDVPVARPTDDLGALVERLGGAMEQRVLVFDQEKLVGIVAPIDLARLLTVRQATAARP
jgi:hypothetical protein